MPDKVRITFSCPSELRDRLSARSDEEGIPRSQLIVELLEYALGAEEAGGSRSAEVNRFLFDVQQRLADLEAWRREINDWKRSAAENTDNLETTVASLLNEQVSEMPKGKRMKRKTRGSIPTPKK